MNRERYLRAVLALRQAMPSFPDLREAYDLFIELHGAAAFVVAGKPVARQQGETGHQYFYRLQEEHGQVVAPSYAYHSSDEGRDSILCRCCNQVIEDHAFDSVTGWFTCNPGTQRNVDGFEIDLTGYYIPKGDARR